MVSVKLARCIAATSRDGMMGTIKRRVEIAGKITRKPSRQCTRSAVLFAATNLCEAIIPARDFSSFERPRYEYFMLEMSPHQLIFCSAKGKRNNPPEKAIRTPDFFYCRKDHARCNTHTSTRLMRGDVSSIADALAIASSAAMEYERAQFDTLAPGCLGRRRGVDKAGVRTQPRPSVSCRVVALEQPRLVDRHLGKK